MQASEASCFTVVVGCCLAEGKPVGALLQEDDYLLALPLEEEPIGPRGRSGVRRPRPHLAGAVSYIHRAMPPTSRARV